MDVTITVTFPTDVTMPFLQKIGGWYVTCCIGSLAKSKSENLMNSKQLDNRHLLIPSCSVLILVNIPKHCLN